MKIKKMDKRFRLFNSGHAAYVVDMPFKDFSQYDSTTSINARLTEAYGPSQRVPHFWGSRPAVGDWFHDYKPNNHIRLYFRREEQAIYLTMIQ